MSAKLYNTHKFPDANHQPRHLASYRRKEATERQVAYDLLSVQEKIDMLDRRLGVGIGAVKQRTRLSALLVKGK